MTAFFFLTVIALLPRSLLSIPRVIVDPSPPHSQFVSSHVDSAPVLLVGTNVVMKGAPWIPSTRGFDVCETTMETGNTTSCQSFTLGDVKHLKDLNYNFIRLGVIWAGGQPDGPSNSLGDEFNERLHDFLTLCDDNDINVLFDLHEDAVGTAVCGEGLPMWFSKLAIPNRIGLPIYPLFEEKDDCGITDLDSWAEYAGDDDYNIKNPCCRKMNQANWAALDFTVQAQETLRFLFNDGAEHYVRYVKLLAEAAMEHPSVIGIELMNEPPAIQRGKMWEFWELCYDAVREISEELAVGIMDTGEEALRTDIGLSDKTKAWLAQAKNLFYAFHDYGKDPAAVTSKALEIVAKRQMPALLTEFGGYGDGCEHQKNATAANIGSSYWHYSDYCWPKHCDDDADGNPVPDGHCEFDPSVERWGACITGWGSGDHNFVCS